MKNLRVLVGCEFSQIVTKAFRDRGCEAYSCDLLPTEGNPDWHIQGNVLDHIDDGWDIGIFHPPCTYLCNSGVRWLYEESDRFEKMKKASKFFYLLFNSNISKIAIENPIPHKYAGLPVYTQIIQPWQFGCGETKATCLWLKGLPKLQPTNVMDGREARIHKMTPSKDRWKNRSRTFLGVAEAMADQWININNLIIKPFKNIIII